jgi:predicted nucleotidyltransferase
MRLTDLVRERRSDILRVAEQHGASNVRLFGSVARGEADESSDIDLLVDLEPGRSLLDHAALILELEELLGRKVDIATERGLRPVIRQRVLQDATLL